MRNCDGCCVKWRLPPPPAVRFPVGTLIRAAWRRVLLVALLVALVVVIAAVVWW